MVTQRPHLAICLVPFQLVANPARTLTVKRDRNTEKCFSECAAGAPACHESREGRGPPPRLELQTALKKSSPSFGVMPSERPWAD